MDKIEDINTLKYSLYNEINSISKKDDELNKILNNSIYEYIKNENIPYSENKNGLFINISCLDKKFMIKLNNFINHNKNIKKESNLNINLSFEKKRINILNKNNIHKINSNKYLKEKKSKKEDLKNPKKELKEIKLSSLELLILSFSTI